MKLLLLFIFVLLPSTALAQLTYRPLVGIPGVTDTGDIGFSSYIQALYALSISIAALLAVIKIIIAGVKWMTTDVVTSKGEAKSDIEGALLGLIIILAAVLILTTINSSILNTSLTFSSAPSGSALGTGGGGGSTPVTPTVESADGYTYIDSSYNTDVKSKFATDCTNSGGLYKPQPYDSSSVRCYPQKPVLDYTMCSSEPCSSTIIDSYRDQCNTLGGNFSVDNRFPKYSVCTGFPPS